VGQAQVHKKIRQAANRQKASVADAVHNALLSIKKWPLRERWQFCRWLLWGKGKWGGVN
jgi:hypothetical protein